MTTRRTTTKSNTTKATTTKATTKKATRKRSTKAVATPSTTASNGLAPVIDDHVTSLLDNLADEADPIARAAAQTHAIAALRQVISKLSAERVDTVREAKATGLTYADLAGRIGMSTARVTQIASGRRSYVPVAER